MRDRGRERRAPAETARSARPEPLLAARALTQSAAWFSGRIKKKKCKPVEAGGPVPRKVAMLDA